MKSFGVVEWLTSYVRTIVEKDLMFSKGQHHVKNQNVKKTFFIIIMAF